MVKEYLQYKETKGFQFTIKGKDKNKQPRFRRALKKVFRDLNVPTDIRAKKIKLFLEEKISLGEIEIGECIVEREYNKLVTKDAGSVVKDTFSVTGRKHPLSKLPVKIFKKHCKFMRLNGDAYIVNLNEA